MMVKIPRNGKVEKLLKDGLYKLVEEDKNYAVYRGIFAIHVGREFTGLKKREFIDFCHKVDVEVGYKRRRGDDLYITPKRESSLKIRLSREELELIREDARNLGLSTADYARRLVLQQAARNRGL